MFVVERMEGGGAQRQIAYMANHLSRRNIEVSLLVVKKRRDDRQDSSRSRNSFML